MLATIDAKALSCSVIYRKHLPTLPRHINDTLGLDEISDVDVLILSTGENPSLSVSMYNGDLWGSEIGSE